MSKDLIAEDHRVDSGEPGLTLLVRNKRSGARGDFGPARTVLMVHGATYPSTVTFDYPVEGRSWMDQLAAAGFDVWCVDLLGYGGSDRPAAMGQPRDANGPLVDTAQAQAQVGRVMDFILARRGLSSLALVGYSWGTAICGGFAASAPEKVARLVLYGALWLKSGAASTILGDGPLGAYRLVEAEAAAKRWVINLDPAQVAAIAPPKLIDTWSRAAVATDPESAGHTPPRLRAPTGVVKDVRDHWLADKPTYDPAGILAPTLVVVGEWDQETTPEQGRAVFARLTNARDRRYVVIGRGTHSLLLENQRGVLHRTVQNFLEEGAA